MEKKMNSETTTYQQMLKKTELILDEISKSDLDLDIMLAKVAEGAELIRQMKSRLEQGKKKLEDLLVEFDESTETKKNPPT